jgi:cobalt/nickel transport system permease protein
MHIPPSMLHGKICPVTAALTACGVATASVIASRIKDKPKASLFGSAAALLFAVQMLNFPVLQGTSGHLLGGVLVSAVLGVPFGVLAVSLVVTLQALLFSDGGFTALGANILNMAILGAGVGGLLRLSLLKLTKGTVSDNFVTAFSAWVSVMLAALACSAELAVGGAGEFAKIAGAMLSVHTFIGIGEALLTVALIGVFRSMPKAVSSNRSSWMILGSAISFALLSPFACQWPDGLEWMAEKYGFLHPMAPSFVSPFPHYSISAISNPFWTTVVSGALGVLTVFALGTVLVKTLVKEA